MAAFLIMRVAKRSVAVGLALLALAGAEAGAERVKDLASVAGVRSNQLVGYGLVVGLDGTGDQTAQAPFTFQSLRNYLAQLGVTVPTDLNPQLNNIAAVSVHAELPPFAKPGQRIDVTVASLGNAESLRGGSLLLAPLRGADGNVYALAQGSLVVSGFGAGGEDGSSITVNVPSSGRIPSGATVERAVPNPFGSTSDVTLNLHTPDFTTVMRLVERINTAMGTSLAEALDGSSVRVRAPDGPTERVGFVAALENLELEPGDAPARVIVNARTGTVVIGSHVRVKPAAVSHGSLVVTIREQPLVSQPPAFSEGETVVVPSSEIEVSEGNQRMFLFDEGVSLNDIVTVVNNVGAAPGDLVAILQALKQAGALRAQLVII